MKKILFSPVGTMDPVANYTDGPLIHIARKVKPDIIYIYISNELYESTKVDSYSFKEYDNLNRYDYCLRNLEDIIKKENPNYNLDIQYIIGKKEDKIYEYNETLNLFREYFNSISSRHKDDHIYLNTSSGTPAMKYALYIIFASAKTPNIKGFQVKTPAKGINKREEKVLDYDSEIYWELNLDNSANYTDRTIDLKIENLNYYFKKESLISHLKNYEYVAAYEVGLDIKEFLNEEVLELLKFAADRIRLIPIRGINLKKYGLVVGDDIKEYILSLSAKLFKHQDSDFIRGITPIFENLLEKTLKEKFGFDVNKVVNNYGKWDFNKFKAEYKDVFDFLNDSYANGLSGYVQSDSLCKIYGYYNNSDNSYKNIEYIREFEYNIRNKVAHTLANFDREIIKKDYKYNLEDILNKIKALASLINPNNNKWDDYDKMNNIIINYIK